MPQPHLTHPEIVIVDDHRDEVLALQRNLSSTGLEVVSTEPENLTASQLEHGKVFLLDMYLSDWPGRSGFDTGAQVFDGIALAGVIRGHARNAKRPPPIIALNTGHPNNVAEMPNEIREHALARAHGLEWVFLKGVSVSTVPTPERVADLARAQRKLPANWSDEDAERQVSELLKCEPGEITEVLDCWPPIREVGRATDGIGVLRWLLHRILPYPCFLLDERHVAARLGITLRSLRLLVTAADDLGDALRRAQYEGVLSSFDGPRWWRSRVEKMLWDLSADTGTPASAETLQGHSSVQLEASPVTRGVVVLKDDYTPYDEAAEVADAVRIQLDDWPPYAEDAWALEEDARESPHLRERVSPLDRDRVSE